MVFFLVAVAFLFRILYIQIVKSLVQIWKFSDSNQKCIPFHSWSLFFCQANFSLCYFPSSYFQSYIFIIHTLECMIYSIWHYTEIPEFLSGIMYGKNWLIFLLWRLFEYNSVSTTSTEMLAQDRLWKKLNCAKSFPSEDS